MELLLQIFTSQELLQAIGITASSGIFVGAALFNGEVGTAVKAVISILIYATTVLLTNLYRLEYILDNSDVLGGTYSKLNTELFTMIIITIAYLLGMLIGVLIVRNVDGDIVDESI